MRVSRVSSFVVLGLFALLAMCAPLVLSAGVDCGGLVGEINMHFGQWQPDAEELHAKVLDQSKDNAKYLGLEMKAMRSRVAAVNAGDAEQRADALKGYEEARDRQRDMKVQKLDDAYADTWEEVMVGGEKLHAEMDAFFDHCGDVYHPKR